MDINLHPDFLETYAGIKRSFGEQWAARFVLAAPLMVGDPSGLLSRAFLAGLNAHKDGDRPGEVEAWRRCQDLLAGFEASVVAEAEALLLET